MNFRNWFKKKRVSRWESDHKRIIDQVALSADFYSFVHAAFTRGYDADLIIRVDGQICKTFVSMNSATTKALFEYFANWAAREKLIWAMRRDEHDKENPEHAYKPAADNNADVK